MRQAWSAVTECFKDGDADSHIMNFSSPNLGSKIREVQIPSLHTSTVRPSDQRWVIVMCQSAARPHNAWKYLGQVLPRSVFDRGRAEAR